MRLFHSAGGRPLRIGLVFAMALVAACSDGTSPSSDTPSLARGGQQGPDLRAAIAAQAKYENQIMAKSGVEGIGVGLTDKGQATVVIMTANGAVGGLPSKLDGVAVKLMPTGPFTAGLPKGVKPQPGNGHGGGHGGGGGGGVDPTGYFARPIPLGVSIANAEDPQFCVAGTYGARVTKGGKYYILSNNHVLARENEASIGEKVQQPGDYDTNCDRPDSLVVGHLSQFIHIDFSGNNTVDAAIASTTTADAGRSTYSGGYGTPSSTITSASIGMLVQKCGRTTGCTHGQVSAVNATINVGYDAGTARFIDQVVISSVTHGSFSDSGDSGSLIVTDDGTNRPVALLFAGSRRTTIGNPIGAVLSALGISIDGN